MCTTKRVRPKRVKQIVVTTTDGSVTTFAYERDGGHAYVVVSAPTGSTIRVEENRLTDSAVPLK